MYVHTVPVLLVELDAQKRKKKTRLDKIYNLLCFNFHIKSAILNLLLMVNSHDLYSF